MEPKVTRMNNEVRTVCYAPRCPITGSRPSAAGKPVNGSVERGNLIEITGRKRNRMFVRKRITDIPTLSEKYPDHQNR